jgi:proteasome assembly chaperone (PAC2) family protein
MGCYEKLMTPEQLTIFERPRLDSPRMVIGLSGWMDSGSVSTGTVEYLIEKLGAAKVAAIDGEDFYIYNFPGSMDIAALFRPTTKIVEGLVRKFEPPENIFYASESDNLLLLLGKEPHLKWKTFADCIFWLAQEWSASAIYFIGSYGGLVPHTRQPRISASVSHAKIKARLKEYGLKFTNYNGPAGISTYLTYMAHLRNIPMASLVAEIPAYVEGKNPRCIDAVVKMLASLLGMHINLDDLLELSDELEKKLNDLVDERPELAELIKKLEQDYDNEIFDTEMGDLKVWLQQHGIQLD